MAWKCLDSEPRGSHTDHRSDPQEFILGSYCVKMLREKGHRLEPLTFQGTSFQETSGWRLSQAYAFFGTSTSCVSAAREFGERREGSAWSGVQDMIHRTQLGAGFGDLRPQGTNSFLVPDASVINIMTLGKLLKISELQCHELRNRGRLHLPRVCRGGLLGDHRRGWQTFSLR